MSGHTPGPWFVSERGFSRRNPVPTVYAVDTDLRYIAHCDDCLNFGEPTDSLANARLIAAAPELLEALVALFNDYKRLADSGDAGFWNLEDVPEGKQALAAIAKATGEQS